LPLASKAPAVPVANFAPGVVDTMWVHFDVQISPGIFEKILNDPNVIFRVFGVDRTE
jgi:hypothetical protein